MYNYLLQLPHMPPAGCASLSSLNITIQLTRDARSTSTTRRGPMRPWNNPPSITQLHVTITVNIIQSNNYLTGGSDLRPKYSDPPQGILNILKTKMLFKWGKTCPLHPPHNSTE